MGETEAVNHEEVLRVVAENNERLRSLIFDLVPAIPEQRSCLCSRALQGARLEP